MLGQSNMFRFNHPQQASKIRDDVKKVRSVSFNSLFAVINNCPWKVALGVRVSRAVVQQPLHQPQSSLSLQSIILGPQSVVRQSQLFLRLV